MNPAVSLCTKEKCGTVGFGGGPNRTGSNPWFFFIMATLNSNNSASPSSWAERSELSSADQQHPKCDVPVSCFRFFLIQIKDGNFQSVSPFLINKTLKSLVGEVKSVKKLRSGDLLVEVTTAKQAELIINCRTFGPYPVSVTPHSRLNFSRGVISEPDLLYTTGNEILENLSHQNVYAVRSITVRRDGKALPTKHVILTFSCPALPSHFTAGYLHCPVRPFIPNPLRCFQCQRFGHSKMSCRGTVTCARCAEVGHDSENCNKAPRCVNCTGPHPSYARSCPSWQYEKEVQTIKTEKNLSYTEARKILSQRTPKSGFSYSAALVSKSVQSIGTQTDISLLSFHKSELETRKNIHETHTQTNRNSKNASDIRNTSLNLPVSSKQKVTKKKITAIKNNQIKAQTVTGKKKLSKIDFLKQRPILENIGPNEDDSLKVYVSPDEDMSTSSGSEEEAPSASPQC